MKSSRTLERSILEATKPIPDHVPPASPLPLPTDRDSSQLRSTGRNEANKATRHNNRVLRFTMAGIGALLLVVPMLIMTDSTGKAASLITTCIALLIFPVPIPLLTELGPIGIPADTAPYAALLVVFIGTSLTTYAAVVTPTA
jgi:VIT1/CCC1 family predicted Fe2+/Mn2+ transporter